MWPPLHTWTQSFLSDVHCNEVIQCHLFKCFISECQTFTDMFQTSSWFKLVQTHCVQTRSWDSLSISPVMRQLRPRRCFRRTVKLLMLQVWSILSSAFWSVTFTDQWSRETESQRFELPLLSALWFSKCSFVMLPRTQYSLSWWVTHAVSGWIRQALLVSAGTMKKACQIMFVTGCFSFFFSNMCADSIISWRVSWRSIKI